MKARKPADTTYWYAIGIAIAILGMCACNSLGSAPKASPEVPESPAPREKDLFSLIAEGNMPGIKDMLKSRELVNKADANGDYPLHLAVRGGETEICEYLLAMGAEIDSRDAKGKTALRLAVDAGPDALIALLARKGAGLFVKDLDGIDPADAALKRNPLLCQFILTRDNVNSADESGRGILHRAADSGSVEATRICLSLNPEINRKDAEGKTALDTALLHPQSLDCAKAAELLVQRGGASFLDDFGWFVRCARDGEFNSRRFDDGNSPLHEAVMRNQRGFVRFLIEKRVELNAKNTAGQTALHEAVRNGLVDCARILLQSGADVNARDLFDNTPILIDMPKDKRPELLRLLLDSRANLEAKDKNGNTPLHVACLVGYPTQEAGMLLDAGARVDSANSDGNTPLMLAVQKENAELIKLLLSRKANMFAQNGKKESPLLVALRRGGASAQLLVNPDTVNIRDDSGNTALMLACRAQDDVEVVKLILKAGADVNARSNSGDTALHIAVGRSRADMGAVLLAAKADIFAANMKGELPITMAFKDPGATMDWILSDSSIKSRDGAGNTAMHYLAKINMARAIGLAAQRGAEVEARNSNGETPLHLAIKADALEAAKALLTLKASLLARDGLGNTPLHVAVQWKAVKTIGLTAGQREALELRNLSGKTALHEACRRDNQEFAVLLLERGAKVDQRDGSGATALMEAIQSGRLDMARFLIDRAGADPRVRDDSGNTPMHVAVKAQNANACRLLLENGADIHARNFQEETPFLLALQNGEGGLALVINPHNVNEQDHLGRTPLHIAVSSKPMLESARLLLKLGAVVDSRDMAGDTALHTAVKNGQLEAAKLLVKSGADLFARNAQAETPLSLAIGRGRSSIEALIDASNVNSYDYLGNTPLHIAAQLGNADACAFIVSQGASKTLANLAGESPYDSAKNRGFEKAAAILAP